MRAHVPVASATSLRALSSRFQAERLEVVLRRQTLRAVHATAASFSSLKLAEQDAYDADGSRGSTVKPALQDLVHPALDDRHRLGCRLSEAKQFVHADAQLHREPPECLHGGQRRATFQSPVKFRAEFHAVRHICLAPSER
jgi:hypothetical protein